jgi:ubiquinone/menaquinone biosynthesis C-methylase UbiE
LRDFRYGFDRLCLLACYLYLLNQVLLKTAFPVPFLHAHFNDLLFLPAALPWVLWIQRACRWRTTDRFPTSSEVFGHLILWTLIAEVVLPAFNSRTVADWWDVIAYTLGAVVGFVVWRLEEKRGVVANFDRLAPLYDILESVLAGSLIMRARVAFLDRWPTEGEVLLAGEGHGRFLCELRKVRPSLKVTVVDASPGMICVARQRLRKVGLGEEGITFVSMDLLQWKPETYDVLCTQFFLDCFEGDDLKTVIEKLAASAKPGTIWHLSDFQKPDRGLPRLRAMAVLPLMYGFFRVFTGLSASRLESPHSQLGAKGFRSIARREWNLGLIYSEVFVFGSDPITMLKNSHARFSGQ